MSGYSNPNAPHRASPLVLFQSLWRHRHLIGQLTKRDVFGRYRGSLLGLAWTFLNPIFQVIVYTFVFSFVFKARWGGGDESRTQFALVLFTGITVFNTVAEVVNTAPVLLCSNVNYVKKTIFPLEILPCVSLASALFHAVGSLVILLLAQLVLGYPISSTTVLLPLVLLPLLMMTLGVAWFLAALGVFLRDIGEVTRVLMSVLLFVSAVFFPITALPERYQALLQFNPLAFTVESARMVLFFGTIPNLTLWAGMLVGGVATAWGGFACFQKMRKAFSDVL